MQSSFIKIAVTKTSILLKMSDVQDVARQESPRRDIIPTTQRTDMMLYLHGDRRHRLRSMLELTLQAVVIRTSMPRCTHTNAQDQ